MKRIFLYASGCLLFVATGCNKFLEKEPDNRAKLGNPDKVSQFLATAYPGNNYQAFTETMSDNVEDIGVKGAAQEINDAYKFIDSKENGQDSPEAYFYSCYSAIAAANQALKSISEAENQDVYREQRGEALVARAYAHFMLVNLWSKFYDPATAATDMGIPYITEPENVVIKQYDRHTVQHVYDMIEKDLLAGLPLINDKIYASPKFHFNRAAATAFATRFYLHKRDYNKVIQYAEETIPGGNYTPSLRGWNDLTSPYNSITDVTELFKVYARSSESANLLLAETISWWGRNYYNSRYGIGPLKQEEVYPRRDSLSGGNTAYKRYSLGQNQLVPKIDEYFVRVSVDANTGHGYVMVTLFAAEEVLFNHAEALYYTGNVQGAIDLLNQFVSRRINSYNPVTHAVTLPKIEARYPVVAGTQNTKRLPSVIQAILAYKRMDFVHEGMRWFDLQRYNLEVVHNIYISPGNNTFFVIAPGDPRRVLQLPQSTTQAGLQPNPR